MPNYHSLKETYLQNQTIKGVPIPDYVAHKVNHTHGDQGSAVAGPTTAQQVMKKSREASCQSLTVTLKKGQWTIFHPEHKVLIRQPEVITAIQNLKIFIDEEESPLIAVANWWQNLPSCIVQPFTNLQNNKIRILRLKVSNVHSNHQNKHFIYDWCYVLLLCLFDYNTKNSK